MSKESNLSKGLLIGFLTGGIVGAGIALLYAPKSGKELRNDIRGKADELYDEADKYFETAKEKATENFNDAKVKAESLIVDAKVKAKAILTDAEKVFTDAKLKANDAIASTKETVSAEGEKIMSAVKAGVSAYKDSKNS